MCGDICQLSLLHSCNTAGFPFGTHPGKTLKAIDGVSMLEVWELMIGDSGKPSELPSSGNCGRRLQGTKWEQVRMAGQTSPRYSSMTNYWRERAYMQPEVCSWLRQRRRAGRRSGAIVQGWWSRRVARDVRKRTRTCIIEFGHAEPTQVTSLTRYSISFKKSHTSQRHLGMFLAQGVVPILDFSRHKIWDSGVNLEMAY